jgi:hypothetical protein
LHFTAATTRDDLLKRHPPLSTIISMINLDMTIDERPSACSHSVGQRKQTGVSLPGGGSGETE